MGRLERQGRIEADDVPGRAPTGTLGHSRPGIVTAAGLQPCLAGLCCDPGLRWEGPASLSILDEFDPRHEAECPDVADEGESPQRFERGREARAELGHMLGQSLAFPHVNDGETGGGRHWVAAEGEDVLERGALLLERGPDWRPDRDGAERRVAPARSE